MRTLVLLLAASVSIASSAARASANSSPSPQITLVEASSLPRPGGGQRIRYTIYQRLQPLLAGTQAGSAATVAAGGAVGLSYEQDPEGWLEVGTIVVESYGPHGAPVAKVAPVAASSIEESRASAPLTLAIAPVAANPARGRAPVVDVALPSADPARLEVLDVMGRRVAMRELGSLGTGRHSVDLGAGQRFAPGVYLLRLTQGNDARVARVTVID
jgi:hypothetical protein